MLRRSQSRYGIPSVGAQVACAIPRGRAVSVGEALIFFLSKRRPARTWWLPSNRPTHRARRSLGSVAASADGLGSVPRGVVRFSTGAVAYGSAAAASGRYTGDRLRPAKREPTARGMRKWSDLIRLIRKRVGRVGLGDPVSFKPKTFGTFGVEHVPSYRFETKSPACAVTAGQLATLSRSISRICFGQLF